MKKLYTLLLALFLFTGTWLKANVSYDLTTDSVALVDFYNAAGGPNWTTQGNWLTGRLSTWSGVTVANVTVNSVAASRVTSLTVESNNISGTVSPSIGNLTELLTLQLNGTETTATYVDLHGALPVELWNCTKITRLQIKYTKISSWDTTGFCKMQALSELNLMATKVGGEIPSALFTFPNIAKVYLHYCNFSGALPATLPRATKLSRLYLWGGNKLSNLSYVDIATKSSAKIELYGNRFTYAECKPYADVSSQYAGYTNSYQLSKDTVFQSFDMARTFVLRGKVANGESYAWFKRGNTSPISTIDSLTIDCASIKDTGLYVCKAISSTVSGFDIRTIYKLSTNTLSLVSDSLSLVDFYKKAGGPNWTNQGNWLTGNISTWSGVSVTSVTLNSVAASRVTGFGVESNNMHGTVSPALGNLSELTVLQLNGTETTATYVDLNGAIPVEMWNCTKLTRLQVKYTRISSWDTTGLYKLQALTEFNFMATKVGGELPAALFALPNIQKLYLHYCSFTGAVPATLSRATKLTRLYLWGGNKLTSIPYVNIKTKSAAKIELYGNFFSFNDIKPYADSTAKYAGYTNSYQFARDTVRTTIDALSATSFDGSVTNATAYAWFKNKTYNDVTTSTLSLTSAFVSDTGTYECKATAPSLVSSFEIRSVYVLKVTPGAAPVVSAAQTDTSGSKIYIVFNKAMSDPSAFAASFTVTVNGSANIVKSTSLNTADSKIIVLELTSKVALGQTASLSYTGSKLASTDGGVLASFSALSVTNQVWVAAPVATEAKTSTDGSSVSVSFSKAMSSPADLVSAFSVKVNGSANVVKSAALDSTSSNIVVLKLTTAVKNGETISLSYSGSSLTSVDGGVLASFTDLAVVNSVASTTTRVHSATSNLSVYPNPFQSSINIDATETIVSVTIIDVLGNVVYKSNINQTELTLSVNNFKSGVYFVQIQIGSNTVVKRIVKQ